MSSLPVLPAGYSPVPDGHLAAVVTYLEMTAPPKAAAVAAPEGVSLERLGADDLERYRAVYRAVGTPWLWFSRLRMSNAALHDILADPRVDAFVVRHARGDVGLLELDHREGDACELAFLGLVPDLVGQGVGRWLMHEAVTRAWHRPIRRFHVHTCTLDHPAAVSFYMRAGFTPIARAVEVAPDPRLTGELPRSAAPHAPIIGPGT